MFMYTFALYNVRSEQNVEANENPVKLVPEIIKYQFAIFLANQLGELCA
jgi:hypothetical protein